MKVKSRAIRFIATFLGVALVAGDPPAAASPLPWITKIYVSSAGSDESAGTSPTAPVRTLARAQQVLKELNPKHSDVEVRISAGTYVAPPLRWNFYLPGHTISFLPTDYEYGEGMDGIDARPVFRGNGTTGFWFDARLPSGHPGGDMGLRFYYLKVERYDYGGIRFHGGTANVGGIYRPGSVGHNGNTVYGMYFQEMGSEWASAGGFGAIDLVNSSSNHIRNNHFVHLENENAGGGIHGVYLAHHSSFNIVENNDFEYVTGTPLKVRNDSNDNIFRRNVFYRSAAKHEGQLRDWYCDADCGDDHDKPRECASHGNRLYDNDNISGYPVTILGFTYYPDIPDYALAEEDDQYDTGGPGCDNDNEARIYAWANE